MKRSSAKEHLPRLSHMMRAMDLQRLCRATGSLLFATIFLAHSSGCEKIETASEEAVFVPKEPDQPPAPPSCTTTKVWKVGGREFEYLPWGQTIHRYDEPRFDKKSDRRENQKRTKKLLRNTVEVMGGSEDLYRFLKLIAMRESSLIGSDQPFDSMGVVHRLSADQDSSYRSWQLRRQYFEGNPLSKESKLWKTYGPFGMNSNYALHHFDSQTDPRVLGDTVAATVTQIVKIAYVSAKLGGDVLCPQWSGESVINTGWNGKKWRRGVQKRDENGKIVKSTVFVPRTWYTIHRAVQSGKICPAWTGDTLESSLKKSFERRANTNRLRPHKEVPAKDLGMVPDDPYHAWAQAWTLSGVKVEKTEKTTCE